MGCSSSAETNDDGSPRHIDGKNNAQSSAPVAPVAPDIVCGYLKKEGAIFTTWKKRFFYLEAGKITYYESETPDKSNTGVNEKGSLYIKDYTVKISNKSQVLLMAPKPVDKGPELRSLLIEFIDPNNEAVKTGWITAFNEHIKYIKDLEEYNNKKLTETKATSSKK